MKKGKEKVQKRYQTKVATAVVSTGVLMALSATHVNAKDIDNSALKEIITPEVITQDYEENIKNIKPDIQGKEEAEVEGKANSDTISTSENPDNQSMDTVVEKQVDSKDDGNKREESSVRGKARTEDRAAMINENPPVVLPLDENERVVGTTQGKQIDKVLLVYEDGSSSVEAASDTHRYTKENEQDVSQLYAEVKEELESITYDNFYEVLQPRESFLDKFNIQQDIRKRTGKQPTEEETKAELKKYYLDKLDMKRSFDVVKGDLPTLMQGVFEHSKNVETNYVKHNKIKILLGLTYLERQYNFDFGNAKAKDLILLYPEVFGKDGVDALKTLIDMGTLSYTDVELSQSANTYKKKIAPITGQNDLIQFIEKGVETFEKNKDISTWLNDNSKAYIVETNSKMGGSTSLVEKMKKDEILKSHLIPLLTLSKDNLYVISTVKTVNYGLTETYIDPANEDQTKSVMLENIEKTANNQQAFLEFWYRITDKKEELLNHDEIIVVDTLQRYGKEHESAATLWSPKYGENTLSGIKEFITPLNLYVGHMFADGQASGKQKITLYLAKGLTDRGQSVYTHELTHMMDKDIWFNGNGRRKDKDVEVFARGLFESLNNKNSGYNPIFNLNTTYNLGEDRVQNQSPERFQNDEDLKKYMQGVMDVVYTLDYAEALAILEKDASDRAILLNKVSLVPDKAKEGRMNDNFSSLSEQDAKELKTIDDLISKGLVSGRLAFKGMDTLGTTEQNGYFVVPLFEPIYAALQNDNGATGDLTFRRYAYELLGEYGYRNGMVGYLSGKYQNDKDALLAILDEKYNGNLELFKKDMFKRRIDNLSRLSPTNSSKDFEDLLRQMKEAVDQDLNQMKQNKQAKTYMVTKVDSVRNLKEKIFKEYLIATSDFRTSIYKEEVIQEPHKVTLKFMFHNEIVKEDEVSVLDGEDLTGVENYVPAISDGIYTIRLDFDRNQLKNITSSKEIMIPLSKSIMAETLVLFDKSEIDKVELVQLPEKTTYSEGEYFSVSGLKLKLTDLNGISIQVGESDFITYAISVEKNDKLKTADTSILVKVANKEVMIPIRVLSTPKNHKFDPIVLKDSIIYDNTEELEDIKKRIFDNIEVDAEAGEIHKELVVDIPLEKGKHKVKVKVIYDDKTDDVLTVNVEVVEKEDDPVRKSDLYEPVLINESVGYFINTSEDAVSERILEQVDVDNAAGEVKKEIDGKIPYTPGEHIVNVKVIYDDNTEDMIGVPVFVKELEKDVETASEIYIPVPQDKTIKQNTNISAVEFIKNYKDMPKGTSYEFISSVDTSKPGTYQIDIIVKYPDDSKDIVTTALIVEKESAESKGDLENKEKIDAENKTDQVVTQKEQESHSKLEDDRKGNQKIKSEEYRSNTLPKTGEATSIPYYIGAMFTSTIGLLLSIFKRKKK
ncbi:TPA: LPXTG cell wall anchor domain-containing protein [Streptococcus suis 92-1400]|uniref:ZmpA/ZmpB/ZmpC family metallo-endopeptidase n=2 Tax=Bacillota TaxID=1239 RepID=UPI0003F5FE47|nr:ZmpA/ZmpB/ZmpC family metallo-endopeptidase [Streptococcus suis]HEM3166591.1 LPXTG cell wall anchor domain-containing protein [Streptococcus suis 92-1400]